MNELPRNGKLDFILSALEYHSKSINEIQVDLGLEKNANTFHEVRQILGKLIKDGFVEELKVRVPFAGHKGIGISEDDTFWISYKPTYEGKEFIKKGCYKKRRLTDFFKHNFILKEVIKLLIAGVVGFLIAQVSCRNNKLMEDKEIKVQTTKGAVKSQ